MKTPHILYLHGFLSSPLSEKAQQTQGWMAKQGLAEHYHCPALPMSPKECARVIEAQVRAMDGEKICVVGSSLGGFLATWAVEEFGLARAVLINPAVRPYALIRQYLGPQKNYQTGEIHDIKPEYADDLLAFERAPSNTEGYWLLLQTADEVLDYRQAVDFYCGCHQTIEEGGDHGFVGYADWLPRIWEFANARSSKHHPDTKN